MLLCPKIYPLDRPKSLIKEYNIPSGNVSAVATAALRAVEKAGTAKTVKQIGRLRTVFLPYDFEIISEEEEARLVAEAAQGAPMYKLPSKIIQHVGSPNTPHLMVAGFGGGSTEFCMFHREGALHDLTVVPQGVLTLTEIQKNMGMEAAKQAFRRALKKTVVVPNALPVVCATGGVWRALSHVLCEDSRMPFLIGQKVITAALDAVAVRPTDSYKNCSSQVSERAPFMPLAAEILGVIIKEVGAEVLVFLDKKMCDALALRLHQKACLAGRSDLRHNNPFSLQA